jgi:hypothetical protein
MPHDAVHVSFSGVDMLGRFTNRRDMTRRLERHPLIEDIISGHRQFSALPAMELPLAERQETPRSSPAPHRPEVPRTGLSVPALSTGERAVLRSASPTVAADLTQAERLHSSPMQRTSRSILAATTADDVDRLRRRAREVIAGQL